MHGVESEHELEDGQFEIGCYCGQSFTGEISTQSNARNDAYRLYREHVRKAMGK